MLPSSSITYEEWKTLPVETLVRRRLLSMTLKHLEHRCTSCTVHFVLNEEHTKDALLNSNEVTPRLYLLQNGRMPRIFQEISGKRQAMQILFSLEAA